MSAFINYLVLIKLLYENNSILNLLSVSVIGFSS